MSTLEVIYPFYTDLFIYFGVFIMRQHSRLKRHHFKDQFEADIHLICLLKIKLTLFLFFFLLTIAYFFIYIYQ